MSEMPGQERPPHHVLLCAAVVVTGAASAVILPPALVGAALLFVLLRVCWLDDNIKSDLMGATEVPPDYHRAAAEVPRLKGPEGLHEDPALVATAMRGQIQAWTAAALGALSVMTLAHSGWPITPAILTAMALITLGYWQADRLVKTIVHIEHGRPLPPRMLASTRAWAHSSRLRGDE
jgi:hypothetical protein